MILHPAINKNGIKLAIFAAITTGFTAVINSLTKPIIKHQIELKQKMLLNRVLPPKIYDNDIQNSCYLVTHKSLGNMIPHRIYLARKGKKKVAFAIETTAPNGYAGNIDIIIGANFNGIIYGIYILKHHETPGLGDKIESDISDWSMSFNGKKVTTADNKHFAVKKDGGDFEQFTGATITPRAVVNAVKNTIFYIKTLPEEELSSLPSCAYSTR